ncbi:hypothetical protein [Thalassovita taeanensis]|uniref:DUF4136 domain-containing protein n=1 Tax=Thalassovita taeanensis TaxID=657014 RepID=A0A1H9I1I7_9RHOB|nr:hypothetical protein [Thalassovita taeanensis]SEQ68436.1 hypothetical protein SAMN04488092_1112 [Thalassovita taeanensis]
MLRRIACFAVLFLAAACTNSNDLNKAPVALGNFALGHNVVVAPKVVKGPVSREASVEEWQAALTGAIAERFDRYEGEKLYHFGTSVEGYVLAQPGIPVVLSPKSVLIINITVWDDALGKKLNDKPEQITVMESLSGDTIVGSGLTQPKEQQMQNLSRNAAKMIQNYLVKMQAQEQWFGPAGDGTAATSLGSEPAAATAAGTATAPETPAGPVSG